MEPSKALSGQANIAFKNRENKSDVENGNIGGEEACCWHPRQVTESNAAADPEKQEHGNLLRGKLADGISVRQQDPERPKADKGRNFWEPIGLSQRRTSSTPYQFNRIAPFHPSATFNPERNATDGSTCDASHAGGNGAANKHGGVLTILFIERPASRIQHARERSRRRCQSRTLKQAPVYVSTFCFLRSEQHDRFATDSLCEVTV